MKKKDIDEKDIEEIERLLQESADKITVMPFEQRYARIAARLNAEPQPAEERVLEPALAAEHGSVSCGGRNAFLRNKWAYIVGGFLLLCLLALAIVLPLTLKKEMRFLFGNLEQNTCSRQEYVTELTESKLETPDFLAYPVDLYRIWTTEEKEVKGWGVDYFDEKNASVMIIDFFDKNVVDIQTIQGFEEICNIITIGKTNIQYYTQMQKGTYNTIALARYKKATYRIQCVSAEEDVSGVFTDLFGEVSRRR